MSLLAYKLMYTLWIKICFFYFSATWHILLPETKFMGSAINYGNPIPATIALDIGSNIWIVAVVDGGYVKMVKIRVTGESSFSWIKTMYSRDTAGCGHQSTFTEACFVSTSAPESFYGIKLVAQLGSPQKSNNFL